jgi:hypothetical protein
MSLWDFQRRRERAEEWQAGYAKAKAEIVAYLEECGRSYRPGSLEYALYIVEAGNILRETYRVKLESE